ncbi:MAG: threonine--tRNA ligase [bacterium]|nr:threonine--tRNA ligase [bacterium]
MSKHSDPKDAPPISNGLADNIGNVRHTLAHLLAAAVKKHYPKAKPSIGPAIDDGFYYDFEFPKGEAPSTQDLPKLEKTMREMLRAWTGFDREEVSARSASAYFKGNPYKLELIKDLQKAGTKITFYTCPPASYKKSLKGTSSDAHSFTDLCRGGHAENPSRDIAPDSFKLDRIAGAYWRGDEKNKMLTRIYGLAFASKEELQTFLEAREEAEKRDHRKLGTVLGIFTFDDDVGPGLPLWLPNGAAMIDELEKLAKEMEDKSGYLRVRTPHIAKESLYTTSGHLPYYKDSMYPPMKCEGVNYYLKAMNCPHHHKIFAARPKSWRDMPVRLAEYGTCYRYEKSGELFGLMRVRSMQMNDAHIYCSEEQFADEFRKVTELYLSYFKIFGIQKYVMRLSRHAPENLGKKYINEPKLWLKTEEMVRRCLTELNVPFTEAEDEAAFYGPKIDVEIWSAIGREFTLATNQVDFAVPARFGLVYTDKDGKQKTPLCIHRAPLSTHERLIGFLIEHFAGAFPLWLAPVQAKIIPISEKQASYAKEIFTQLRDAAIRVELDDSNDTLGKRIRNAKLEKVPYTLVVGDAEIKSKTATLESRSKGKIGALSVEEIINKLKQEISSRAL